MQETIVNKQISKDTIIKTADYLKSLKDEYLKLFNEDESKNANLSYNEQDYTYKTGRITFNFNITEKNGKSVTKSEYDWFVENMQNTKSIQSVKLELIIGFYSKGEGSKTNNIFNQISIFVYFRENDVDINVRTTNQDNQVDTLFNNIVDILNNNKDRYDKTIKFRKLKIQSFCISIGIVISYILFVLLKFRVINVDIQELLSNKYFVIIGQWIIAITLGNLTSYWFIYNLYKPLLPKTRYKGYDTSARKSVYMDDIDEYKQHCEIHIGKYFDADKRRLKIENIFKVTRIVILVQVLVSVILFLVLR